MTNLLFEHLLIEYGYLKCKSTYQRRPLLLQIGLLHVNYCTILCINCSCGNKNYKKHKKLLMNIRSYVKIDLFLTATSK